MSASHPERGLKGSPESELGRVAERACISLGSTSG